MGGRTTDRFRCVRRAASVVIDERGPKTTLLFTVGCDARDATPRSLRNCTTSELALCVHMKPTMNKTKKTEKPVQIPTIDTLKLDAVTGGCGACGNPKHKATQPE